VHPHLLRPPLLDLVLVKLLPLTLRLLLGLRTHLLGCLVVLRMLHLLLLPPPLEVPGQCRDQDLIVRVLTILTGLDC
jgi:hypothetical protein